MVPERSGDVLGVLGHLYHDTKSSEAAHKKMSKIDFLTSKTCYAPFLSKMAVFESNAKINLSFKNASMINPFEPGGV